MTEPAYWAPTGTPPPFPAPDAAYDYATARTVTA